MRRSWRAANPPRASSPCCAAPAAPASAPGKRRGRAARAAAGSAPPRGTTGSSSEPSATIASPRHTASRIAPPAASARAAPWCCSPTPRPACPRSGTRWWAAPTGAHIYGRLYCHPRGSRPASWPAPPPAPPRSRRAGGLFWLACRTPTSRCCGNPCTDGVYLCSAATVCRAAPPRSPCICAASAASSSLPTCPPTGLPS
mmetsp:Transcript_66238/g.181612  ORF Transcript_66238/g.181612 Transcript_66238/m.181612 type:complete len:200 (+) Transcript_66238:679-1278(+)